jgi:PEP-CTERM motif-containing protein
MKSTSLLLARAAAGSLFALALAAFGDAQAGVQNFGFTSQGSAVYTPCNSGNCVQGSAFGQADDLGNVIPGSWASSLDFSADLGNATATGTWQFFDVGPTSTNDLSGTFTATLNPSSTTVGSIAYTITSGDGLFSGASGSGSSTISLVDAFGGFADFAETGTFAVTTPVPEPSSISLMFAGLAIVGYSARRRRAARAPT